MTYYEILQVTENASEEVIRMAYKALAKKYHPDVYNGNPQEAEEKMKFINEAFEVLSNPEKRKLYDDFLANNKNSFSRQNTEEPAPSQEQPSTKRKSNEFKCPTITKSGWIIGILLVLSFTQVIHPYLESDYYDYAFVFGFIDFSFLNLIMLPIPLFIGVLKKSITPKGIKLLCVINSIAIFLVGIVLNILEITSAPLVGWLLVLFYYFINKHILLQLKQHEFSKTKAICVISASFLIFVAAFLGGEWYKTKIIRGDSNENYDFETDNGYFGTQEIFGNSSNQSNADVEWLSDYDFFYYEEESVYVLTFLLKNKNELPVAEAGSVNISIINSEGENVYKRNRGFTSLDSETWQFGNREEKTLTTIYINPDDIREGSYSEGTIFFTVEGNGYQFDEISLSVYDLPVKSGNSSTTSNSNSITTPPKTTTSSPPVTTTTQPTQSICVERTCNAPAINGTHYCSTHKCENPKCSFKKDYSSQYCSVCVCSTASCKKLSIDGGSYCPEHTCSVGGCVSEVSYNAHYCFSHKCMSCDSVKVANGSYCANHTCATNECTSQKSITSDFCNSHECMAGLCHKERQGLGQYCLEHTCIEPGCTKQKFDGTEYCYSHNHY